MRVGKACMANLRLLSVLLGVLVITASHAAVVVPPVAAAARSAVVVPMSSTAAAATNRRSLTPTTGHPRRQLSAATNTTATIDAVLAKQWDILLAFRAQNVKCLGYLAPQISDWPTVRPKTPTGWPGVTVKGNRIVGIDFSVRGLCHFLPPSFSALTSLTSLDMSVNLGGPGAAWPPSWSALTRLTYLNLNLVHVMGKPPVSWTALKNLKIFKFSVSMNGPDLPAAWGTALTALTQMDFPDLAWPGNTSNTPGQKLVPASWAALKQLRTITIPCNALTTKPATNGIPFAPHITSLTVGLCSGTGDTGGPHLAKLHSLKHFVNIPSLDLESEISNYESSLPTGPISFSLPPEWGALVKLTSLMIGPSLEYILRPDLLTDFRFQPILPAAWSTLTNLQRLVVDGHGWAWKFSNGPPASWYNLQALTQLKLLSWSSADGYDGTYIGDQNVFPSTPGRVVPRTWGKLTRLRHLDLTDYGLTGMTLPSEWGAMRQLSVLRLSGNCVSGPVPATWGLLTNLGELSLPDQGTLPAICKTKKLIGALPNTWQHLTKVRSLQLSGHSLNGTLPPSWGGMVGLQTLSLQGNQLRGPIPASWSRIANLTTLDLSHNKRLSGPLPLSFSALKRLSYLDVSDNAFSGSVPPGPQWTSSGLWDKLTYVDLSKNAFSGKTPVKPKFATYFNITGNKFVG